MVNLDDKKRNEIIHDIAAYIIYKDKPSPREKRIHMWDDIPTNEEIVNRARYGTSTQNLLMIYKLIQKIVSGRYKVYYQSSDYVSFNALTLGLDDLYIDHYAYIFQDKRKRFYAEDLDRPNLYSCIYEPEVVDKFIKDLNMTLDAIEKKDEVYLSRFRKLRGFSRNSYILDDIGFFEEYHVTKGHRFTFSNLQTWSKLHSRSIKGKPINIRAGNVVSTQ